MNVVILVFYDTQDYAFKVILCLKNLFIFQCVKSRSGGWSWRGPAARERSQRRTDWSDHTGRGSPPGLLVAGGQSAGSTCVSGLTCTTRTMGKFYFSENVS